jgi:DNA modification methylase
MSHITSKKSPVRRRRPRLHDAPSASVKCIQTLHDLTLDPQNANRGTARGQHLLTHSLQEFGAARSIVTDRAGRVIAGNKTVTQATDLDLPVEVVQTRGDRLVVVQRLDLDLLDDSRARRLAIADNRTSELDLEWNTDQLRAHLGEGLDLQEFWSQTELERLCGEGLHPGQDDPDRAFGPRDTDIQVGDLFALGPHRLLCGDATDAGMVTRLLDDVVPELMNTDPPYAVDYDPEWRVRATGNGRTATGRVMNDDRVDWQAAFRLFAGDVAYVWHAGLHAGRVATSLEDGGFVLRAQIIWVKQHFALSRGDLHWRHEPCWYAVRKGASSHWCGDRTQTTVWEVPNLNPFGGWARDGENAVTGHGTQKPVRLFEIPILNHTQPGDAVYDPFVGSGTALIAAQKTGRRGFALELDPRYVQTTIDRWEAYSGAHAQKLEGAR